MILTEEIIEAGKSKNGGWSKEQLSLLGETFKPNWKKRIIGKEFKFEIVQKFLYLKNRHLEKR